MKQQTNTGATKVTSVSKKSAQQKITQLTLNKHSAQLSNLPRGRAAEGSEVPASSMKHADCVNPGGKAGYLAAFANKSHLNHGRLMIMSWTSQCRAR